MKLKITKLFKSALRLTVLVLIGFMSGNLSAQSPWCANTHTNPCGWGGGTTISLVNSRGIITATNISQNGNDVFDKAADLCSPSAGAWSLINTPSNAFNISAGGTYEITATIYSGCCNYVHDLAIFIDLNRDNVFSTAECINPTQIDGWPYRTARTITVNIPCTGVSAGATRLRMISSRNGEGVAAGAGCGNIGLGETEDYSINLQIPSSLTANFVVPAVVYTDYNYKFINSSQAAIFNSDWDKDANSTYDANTSDYTTQWSVPSTQQECLKLRVENCLGKDSITQCFDVVVPTQVPAIDFISNKTVSNLFGEVKLNDLTDFGPTSWQWEVYDSSDLSNIKALGSYITQNGTSLTSQNPEFLFLESGKYTVCLTATNGVGASIRTCKMDYITVLPLQDFQLGAGPSVTTEAQGRIYDHAGPGADYSGTRSPNTDKLLINPCGATQINFEFSQIKFGTGEDSLFIYAGENAGAPRVAAIGRGAAVPYSVTVMGGAAFVTFQTNNATGVDSGYIGTFNSTLVDPKPTPNVDFDLPTDGFFGVEIDLIDNSTDKLGIPTHQWDIYEPATNPIPTTYTTEDAAHTFLTTGQARVCLTVDGCAGSGSKCKLININVPSTPTELDYNADQRRPDVSDVVQMTTTSDKANQFLWSVFPVTATFSSSTAKNPTVSFTAPGCYTFTLRAWNSADSAATVKTLVKDKFVCVQQYCEPVVTILSSDVAISNFSISKSGTTLMGNPSDVGVSGYTDFSATKSVEATFGASYDFEIKRASGVDEANTKVWVDYNLDGEFDPITEEAASFAPSKNTTLTGTINVPSLSSSFIGTGRIRVSMAYGNTPNTVCGPVTAGEVEDYGIKLDNDMMPPTITLNGMDTVYVERTSPANYVDAGAMAFDATEGDLTANIVTTTDMDQTTAGIYSYNYCITDASGNGPICVTRTVYVVLDRTKPLLTVSPTVVDLEVLDPFMTSSILNGATALDNVDGDLTPSITTMGTVNPDSVGTYVITYSVSDVQGNTETAMRTYNVKDTKAPIITAIGSEQIQINTIWADQTQINDGYYNGVNGNPKVAYVATPGPNGLPNTTVRASYPVTYTGVDASGNAAIPVLRNYVVDDFVAPEIDLKTLDTVIHRVNTTYNTTPAVVTDNFYNSSSVSLVLTNPGAVDAFTLGTYTENYEAVDGSGNKTTATRYVKVIDDLAPTIFAPAINGCAGYPIKNMADLQISDNYDAPSALMSNLRFTQNNVNVYVPGYYSMTYQITDLSGNESKPFTRTVFITSCTPAVDFTDVKTINLTDVTTVYPNPTTGNLNVKVAGVSNQEIVVTVYNAIGAEVAQAREVNGEEIKIDLNNQASGIYTVKVTTGGQITTSKVTLTK